MKLIPITMIMVIIWLISLTLSKTRFRRKLINPLLSSWNLPAKSLKRKRTADQTISTRDKIPSAAKNFSGTDLKQDTVGLLIKSLLNAEKPEPKPQPKGVGGLLGSLLSGFTGQSSAKNQEQEQGLGMDDLIKAGLAFYQSKQEGDSNTEAMVDALMAASPLGQSNHRKQSGSIVASSIMEFAKSFMN